MTVPGPDDFALWRVADLLARIVQVREAIADDDLPYAAAGAERLEEDLLALRRRLEQQKP